jgi:hypothetical protein
MLKLALSLVVIETRATMTVVINALKNLDSKIGEYNGDIEGFNLYVSDLIHQLMVHGEPIPEIVPHLFSAYSKVPNQSTWKRLSRARKTVCSIRPATS